MSPFSQASHPNYKSYQSNQNVTKKTAYLENKLNEIKSFLSKYGSECQLKGKFDLKSNWHSTGLFKVRK